MEKPKQEKNKAKKLKVEKTKPESKSKSEPKPEVKVEPKPESKKEFKLLKIEPKKEEPKPEEPQAEGELAIDVYETDNDIIIQSTIGGVKPEDLDISVEEDLVTIRGSREKLVKEGGKKYFYQECYWGSFMRQVILPEEVDGAKARASMKNGVLTLAMPKLYRKKKRKIMVKPDE